MVSRDDLQQQLLSGSLSERRSAARWFAVNATESDREFLKAALSDNPDHWTHQALRDALGRFETSQAATTPEDFGDLDLAEALAEAYARSERDMSKTLVHELRRFVGFAKLTAAAELPDYESSELSRELERLSGLLLAVESLGNVATSSAREDFDLSEIIVEEAARERTDFGIEVQCRGPTPLVVNGNARLIELVLRAGLRNACEAVCDLPARSRRPIVVVWDTTDRDVWISVIDGGPGVPSGLINPFEFAASTKDSSEHFGAGLAVARKAMASLQGEVSLVNNATVGACFRARWPISGRE